MTAATLAELDALRAQRDALLLASAFAESILRRAAQGGSTPSAILGAADDLRTAIAQTDTEPVRRVDALEQTLKEIGTRAALAIDHGLPGSWIDTLDEIAQLACGDNCSEMPKRLESAR